MPEFVEPRYGGRTLAELLPSVVASLDGGRRAIELPSARKYVVLLIDGLGYHQLEHYGQYAETMASALRADDRLTCSVPSTTATSLTSLGCGTPPGQHGILGYSFYEPSVRRVVNALTWADGPEDLTGFAQTPTIFSRLNTAGRATAAVTLGRFADSALTRLAFNGTTMFPVTHEGDQDEVAGLVLGALEEAHVVYCYERMLDHDGHGFGVGAWQWLERLGAVDDLVTHLTTVLPSDTCLLVTGDHGMINVPEASRLVAEDHPLLAEYGHLGGEPRFRHVYGAHPRALAQRWRSVLGERALVLRREEAIDAGWFGPLVTATSSARIGDVVAAMREDFAVMSRNSPGEFGLIGMHGSLTAAEMEVPLLAFGGEA